ncbi:MAG TPA: vWA domain-containing protein [Armatimonadota bacterium]|nr:vWA domain-containing protein [Armatimonadota bacterium]
MIRCQNQHENPDDAQFCLKCQLPLKGQEPPKKTADVVFCFDTTGSMGGEIDDLKASAVMFAQELNSHGVHFQVGLVEFRDLKHPEPPGYHQLAVVAPLSENAVEFHNAVQSLRASGGGDEPESSLDAIREALNLQGYRGGTVRKYIVLVTDASPNEPDHSGKTVDQLVQEFAQDAQARLMLVVPDQVPAYQRIKSSLGSRAELLPIVAAGKRADFQQILDRVVQGTAVIAGV